jgi:hypothetical protein
MFSIQSHAARKRLDRITHRANPLPSLEFLGDR